MQRIKADEVDEQEARSVWARIAPVNPATGHATTFEEAMDSRALLMVLLMAVEGERYGLPPTAKNAFKVVPATTVAAGRAMARQNKTLRSKAARPQRTQPDAKQRAANDLVREEDLFPETA